MFDGHNGSRLTWAQLMEAVAESDAIIMGEEHDDAVGHAIQLAVVEDIFERWPGCALSLEMLDREEQATADDYLAGIIDRETFIERTASTRWRKISNEYLAGEIDRHEFEQRIMKLGWPNWVGNYQPIVDAAKLHDGSVVAANTPWRRYASLANKEGHERLASLTPSQKALFDVPHEAPQGPYRERFWETIAGRAEGQSPPPKEQGEGDAETQAAHPSVSDEDVLGMFRAQLLMDATMAASISNAMDAGAAKVIHLVGKFHSDFEGGLVLELRHRQPDARILTLSVQSDAAAALADDDKGRADIVIYSGSVPQQ